MKFIKPADIPLYRQDLRQAAGVIPDRSLLSGRTVLITGATGLIGSAVVDMLLESEQSAPSGLTLLLAVRNKEKAARRFGSHPALQYLPYDAERDIPFNEPADFIIHGAGNAYPQVISSYPVETMAAGIEGTRRLLEYARTHGVRRTLFLSSSEVYGVKKDQLPFREQEYGSINPLNPRSCYAVSKRAAETLCVSYGAEYGLDTVIVRPGHIYGPTAAASDNRVSSAFAHAAASGEPLVMKSAGAQLRSYCYCADCASAILTVLARGESSAAYNISCSRSVITIRQMAEALAQAGGVGIRFELPDAREKSAFNPMNNASLASEKLEALGWRALFDAETGLSHTVEILKALKKGGANHAGGSERTGF